MVAVDADRFVTLPVICSSLGAKTLSESTWVAVGVLELWWKAWKTTLPIKKAKKPATTTIAAATAIRRGIRDGSAML
jgi:hypothetical protein